MCGLEQSRNLWSMARQLRFSFLNKQHSLHKYTEEAIQTWIAMYHEGKSYREIANIVQVPYPTVFWRVHTRLGLNDGRGYGRKKKYVGLTKAQVSRQVLLRARYNMTLEDYDRMVSEQDGLCAICEKPPRGGRPVTAKLHVDHDHATGRVRSLLCSGCNAAIGHFQNDPVRAEKASVYLRRHRASVELEIG